MSIVKLSIPKFRLRTTIVIPFVLQIIAAVSIVGYLSFRNGQHAVNVLADRLNGEISARIEQHVIGYLNKSQNTLWLTKANVLSGNLNLKDFEGMQRYFWQIVHKGNFEGYLSYGNEKGEFVGVEYQEDGTVQLKTVTSETIPQRETYALNSVGDRQKFLKSAKYDPRDRPWYKAAKQAGKTTWSEIYPFFSSKNTVMGISPVSPIFDSQGNLQGVLCINVRLTQVTDFLSHLQISANAQSFIIERTGNLVASSAIAQPFKVIGEGDNRTIERLLVTQSDNPMLKATARHLLEKFGSFAAISGSQNLKFQSSDGGWYYVQVLPIKDEMGIDWLTVVVVPENDFMGQINQNNRDTLFLCLGALIISILLGIRAAHLIARPLLQLAKASEQVAEGNLEQQIHSSAIVEIATLSHSFNHMTAQLKESFAALYQSQESLRLANEELEARVERRTAELRKEKERSEQLLLNVLPASIADRLKQTNESPAEHFEDATILFADIVGFTSLSARMEPLELVSGLNQIFSAFDQLTEKYGLEKIKTIGDAYMVVGGLPISRPDHAKAIADMALDMQAYIQNSSSLLSESIELRIGINTGAVIAGVIGIKKFIYDLWGDAVNVASRMESHGKPGYIQVTEATYQRLKGDYLLESRGPITVKGRGEMVTYWLIGKK
ncbi:MULTISPECIES: adenylate/guanylate cyclase domain-containing protein [Pseudanabaena]|uniref:Adenylate cyclase n=2 Tax=Pseudanabaena TaxID=1152 RepID=L8N8W6_9CYAN|nr:MULTISPECIES: adenylate/guanylate cyclase domain-containing protein [Pseudanabaena]ELS34668.1 adenylate/guanylate cyclase with integral membrane sensor [Pseudanabaena biceps PCC 7429]MDG3493104.1 adenylate/guanylate cyclase domain-containing protein [Pseudanabaena catenata USMAC16]